MAINRSEPADFVTEVAAAAGMLTLWVQTLPIVESLDEPLTLGGYALIALAWTLFIARLWQATVGSESVPAVRDKRPITDPVTE